MEGLNSFITSFCGSCILLGFLFVLCPSGGMAGSVKYIFCLCFLCCVLGAAFSIKTPDFSQFSAYGSSEILSEQNAAVTAQTVFCEALRQKNINFRKITVDTNKLNDGSIIISKVTVYSSDDSSRIVEAIGSDSYKVVIINE
ncbi:MAG: hypothetical protein IKU82_01115 [Clostridia bacterium]|nr:hypothetical protein [Clostridia bacterium]